MEPQNKNSSASPERKRSRKRRDNSADSELSGFKELDNLGLEDENIVLTVEGKDQDQFNDGLDNYSDSEDEERGERGAGKQTDHNNYTDSGFNSTIQVEQIDDYLLKIPQLLDRILTQRDEQLKGKGTRGKLSDKINVTEKDLRSPSNSTIYTQVVEIRDSSDNSLITFKSLNLKEAMATSIGMQWKHGATILTKFKL